MNFEHHFGFCCMGLLQTFSRTLQNFSCGKTCASMCIDVFLKSDAILFEGKWRPQPSQFFLSTGFSFLSRFAAHFSSSRATSTRWCFLQTSCRLLTAKLAQLLRACSKLFEQWIFASFVLIRTFSLVATRYLYGVLVFSRFVREFRVNFAVLVHYSCCERITA